MYVSLECVHNVRLKKKHVRRLRRLRRPHEDVLLLLLFTNFNMRFLRNPSTNHQKCRTFAA